MVPKKLPPPWDLILLFDDHHDVDALYARGGKECSELRQPADGLIHITLRVHVCNHRPGAYARSLVAICLNLMGRQRLSAETMDGGNYFRRGERKSAINICMHGEFWPLWDISWLNWAENLEIKEGRLKILNCLNFIARKADWSRTAGLNVLAKNRRHWQVNFIDSGLKVAKMRF